MNDWDKYIEENAVSVTTDYINGLHYKFATLNDGWIAIFEIMNGKLCPIIQAADMSHAKEYCIMREPVTIPLQAI